jgi:ABC-2 type transport system permease protein
VDVWADPVAAKRLIGVLPDNMALPERLTGRELLTYLGLLRGLDRATVAARAGELLEVLELAAAERTLVTDYSAGMRKKVTLATALLHTPRLLVLDEPFEAIDPVSAATIRAILQRFVDAGGSVIISSHVMTLVEQVCDHVGVIAGGPPGRRRHPRPGAGRRLPGRRLRPAGRRPHQRRGPVVAGVLTEDRAGTAVRGVAAPSSACAGPWSTTPPAGPAACSCSAPSGWGWPSAPCCVA